MPTGQPWSERSDGGKGASQRPASTSGSTHDDVGNSGNHSSASMDMGGTTRSACTGGRGRFAPLRAQHGHSSGRPGLGSSSPACLSQQQEQRTAASSPASDGSANAFEITQGQVPHERIRRHSRAGRK